MPALASSSRLADGVGQPAQLLQRPAGRVYFAGDWLTHLIAWQAGALESARKVVTELHHRVLKEA